MTKTNARSGRKQSPDSPSSTEKRLNDSLRTGAHSSSWRSSGQSSTTPNKDQPATADDAVSSAKKQKVRKLTHLGVGSDYDCHLIAPTPVMEVLWDGKLKEKITKDVSNEHASHKLSRFQQRFQASDHE
ncbi:uncharacterized protein B0T23DRAFT_436011 [Neurospora hispaniola]|uniref:Uncharacterized protein n=1 Tax=Neurospora hispaniola TaxID=588809 RepID=A0AAJ0MW65_9PEZI|nr:hypothetical protein B0T23DRAFT_436011 [Neurospora hispaniola]